LRRAYRAKSEAKPTIRGRQVASLNAAVFWMFAE
jgi:hypothetical protein